jgi:hypothetical protein
MVWKKTSARIELSARPANFTRESPVLPALGYRRSRLALLVRLTEAIILIDIRSGGNFRKHLVFRVNLFFEDEGDLCSV